MLAHCEPPYAGCSPKGRLTNSEAVKCQSILLPLFPGMTDQEQDVVLGGFRLEGNDACLKELRDGQKSPIRKLAGICGDASRRPWYSGKSLQSALLDYRAPADRRGNMDWGLYTDRRKWRSGNRQRM